MNGADKRLTGSCGACRSTVPPTPESKVNRPALSSIDYRVGTFASFREAMLQAISRQPELSGWSARTSEGGGYGIALLEMWAYMADIPTFYQERAASEAFLRTALLDESVLKLARLLDYRPAPGKAAETHLAFRAEKDSKVLVPAGLRVQSVPVQDERPQKFETLEAFEARTDLNKITVYPAQVSDTPLAAGRTSGLGVSDLGHLATGDNVVFYEECCSATATTKGVPPKRMKVVFGAGDDPPTKKRAMEAVEGMEHSFEETMRRTMEMLEEELIGSAATYPSAAVHVEDKSVEDIRTRDWRRELTWAPPVRRGFPANTGVHAWIGKMRLFGHNAPDEFPVPRIDTDGNLTWQTEDYDHASSARSVTAGTELDLDSTYDNLKLNTEILVVCPSAGVVKRTTVVSIEQASVQAGPADAVGRLHSTVSRIQVNEVLPVSEVGGLDARDTVIYELTGPEVDLMDWRYADSVAGSAVYVPLEELNVRASEAGDLFPDGRSILLEGEDGTTHAASVTNCTAAADHLKIEFTPSLPTAFDSATAVLHGNVARAGHGEKVAGEVLGSGSPAEAFQAFSLRKSPVTFTPDPSSPHGATSTLEVRADGVLWKEVRRLYGSGSGDRVYTTETDAEGVKTVRFGDGERGARPPAGRKNITATYRQGIGKTGNVPANTLKTLLDRPKGLREVRNPADATGGVEPEGREETRSGTPNSVRTFDRVVSLRDFEDAARDFVGVAKARAGCTWDGETRLVVLTAAGDDGAAVEGKLKSDLRAYLDARRDPNRLLRIQKHVPVAILSEVELNVDEAYEPSDVRAAVEKVLLEHFAFKNRGLGQAVHLSDLYGIIQDVDGVDSLRITRLQFKNPDDEHPGAGGNPVLPHLWLLPRELATVEDAASDAIITAR